MDISLDSYESLVTVELRKLRARTEARRLFDLERLGGGEPFDADTLDGILSRPPEPAMRIDGLVPWESGVLAVAQRKTGKTTLCANYARALLTGEDFLGRFGVRKLDGDVAVLNFEVAGGQLARWLHEAGVPGNRAHLVNLRGRRNPFSNPEDRARLAGHLRSRGVEAIIVDPFGRAYTGASQNDAGEVGAWLVDLDVFVRSEVGATDLLITAHAGWNGERTRGSSALEDWADVFWTLTRDAEADQEDRSRFFRAEGRDVDVSEDQLTYDVETRRLALAGTGGRSAGREQRKLDDLVEVALKVIAKSPGMNGEQVAMAMKGAGAGFRKGAHSKVLQPLVDAGRLIVEPGERGAKLYHLPPTYPQLPPGVAADLPPDPLGDGGGSARGSHPQRGGGRCPHCGDPLSGPALTKKCRDSHQETTS